MAFEERPIAAGVGAAESAEIEAGNKHAREDTLSRLFQEGYRFDFFQSIWLLEHAFPDYPAPGESQGERGERIRIRPHNGLRFPPSDIRKIEWMDSDDPRVQMTVTFMGLYGVASPLPVYFYDAIGTGIEDADPLRDFLDIFNHRLYSLFYQAWKKYRLLLQAVTPSGRSDARVLMCLAGIGTDGFVRSPQVTPLRLTALAGLLAGGVRNALGLQTVITALLDGLPSHVVENVLRWVSVKERPRMGGRKGGGMTLGGSALIGQKVCDASGKFRIVLGPLGLSRFRALLPNGPQAGLLDYLVRLYATDFLDYEIELLLKTAEVPPMKLGGSQKLGIDAWLGRPEGEVISVVVQYPE